jgi:hypothetical protein
LLAHIPSPEHIENIGYALPDRTHAHWARLEDAIIHATSILAKEFSLSAVCPFSLWAYGYHSPFKSPQTAHECCMLARNWFPIWMGLFSFVIASSESIAADKQNILNKSIPRWFEVLADAGFDQTWLAGINSSTVCLFQPDTSRMGAFVHVAPSDRQQPMIPWFCYFHVPVWY